MDKVKEQLLKQYKKANAVAKARILARVSMMDTEYIMYLTGTKPVVKKIGNRQKKLSDVKPIIHSVIVLDASGSMDGGKYENSKAGIRKEFEKCSQNKDCDFTFTLVEFVQKGKIITHFKLSKKVQELTFYGAKGNDTPLYNTVLDTLKDIDTLVPKNEKVLFSVFTDGGDNSSKGTDRQDANQLIKKLEKENFTVTFVATTQDMARIKRDLSLEESNTLAVSNDSVGFMKSFALREEAVQSYSRGVSTGLDVSKGFYKKTI